MGLKNIDVEKALDLKDLVAYQEGQVVSRTLVQNDGVSVTLFAFAAGEEISTHESKGDALVQILEGQALITIAGKKYELETGQSIVMPAEVPHAVEARSQFKMSLLVVF